MRTKKVSLVIWSAILVLASFPPVTLATEKSDKEDATTQNDGAFSSKDEVIYGNMDANGMMQDLYVVNTFRVTEPGKMIDHGDYTAIRNLSNLHEMEKKQNNTVHFQADEEEFYYQGKMENQPLPWDVSITYLLDGKEIEPNDLAGKSGSLEIQLSTSKNEEVDPVFFENYILQIAITLDPAKANNIQAPEGTEANAGKNKQITFSVMPEQEEEVIVSADVTNFEMQPIEINAAPYSMSIESPDIGGMTGKMQDLAGAISEVNSGVGELSLGIDELNQGAKEISNGSSEYRSGIKELDQSSSVLVNGSSSIQDAIKKINKSVQASTGNLDLSQLQELPAGLRQVAGGLKKNAQGIDTLKENYSKAYHKLDEAIANVPSYNISEAQINKLYESNANKEVVNQLVETYRAANAAKQTYNAVKGAFGSVTDSLNQSASGTREMAANLEAMASELEKALKNMDGMDAMAQLQEGFSSLSSEYQSFHNGLLSYTDGVSKLASSYGKLDTGIQELEKGTAATSDGANELHKGTNELQEATNDLPGQIKQETDEMMEEYDNSDFEPKSFVSDQNKNVEVVQFVLQTESIKIPEPEITEAPVKEEKGIWERFLDLFR